MSAEFISQIFPQDHLDDCSLSVFQPEGQISVIQIAPLESRGGRDFALNRLQKAGQLRVGEHASR